MLNNRNLNVVCEINPKIRSAIYALGSHSVFYGIKIKNWVSRLV